MIGSVRRSFLSTVLLLLIFLAACRPSNRPARIGQDAPDFTVQDGQQTITLSKLRGKTVVLNFWATWCPPCVEEMPSLVELQQKMGDKLTVLAVSLDEDEDAYKKFVDTRAKGLTTIRDGKQTSNALYGTYRFPESFVIDKDGKIQRKFIGAVDWTSPEILDYFNKL
jgi:cytochrome c biogenesis protein CcmG, thiol:disulfide interchange protein DsbE